jgi:hypothetical protein
MVADFRDTYRHSAKDRPFELTSSFPQIGDTRYTEAKGVMLLSLNPDMSADDHH